MKLKSLILIFIVIAFIGFIDAAYLSANYVLGIIPPCFITEGCDTVTTSAYSKILNIPVAVIGLAYYLAMFLIGLYLFENNNGFFRSKLPYIASVGLLASIWFTLAQIFLIKAFCTYCLLSATTSTLLFIVSILIVKKKEEILPDNL